MRFTCYKNDLIEALQVLIYSVAVKPMTPILSGVYIKADEDGLEMQSNNFSMGTILRLPVNVESYGEVVVSGKKFQDFIRNMPEDTITLFGEEAATTFSLESGGAHIDLLTMSALEFPKVKVPDTYGSFKIRSVALKNLIRKTIFAVAKDNDRPVFKGCSFELEETRLKLVATNAQRIAIAAESVQSNDSALRTTFVVPPETLRCLMQQFDPNDVENLVEIKYSDRIVTFKFNNIYITSRIIDGEFPGYERIFDTEFMTSVEVNKAEFRNAVDLISLTCSEADSKAIKLDITPGHMEISASSPEVGEARKTLEADVSGDRLEIAFNVDFVIDGLRAIDSPRVLVQFGNRYDPALFRESNNENYSYAVTPVRF